MKWKFELPNKWVDQNKRVWRVDLFIYYMENEGMVKFFSHLLHEKLKVWLKNIPKKLSEHARLLGISEYCEDSTRNREWHADWKNEATQKSLG